MNKNWDKDFFFEKTPSDGDIICFAVRSSQTQIMRVGIVIDASSRFVQPLKQDTIGAWEVAVRGVYLKSWTNTIILPPLLIPNQATEVLQEFYDDYIGITEAL